MADLIYKNIIIETHHQVYDKLFPDMAAIFPSNRSQQGCEDVIPTPHIEDNVSILSPVNHDADFVGTNQFNSGTGDNTNADVMNNDASVLKWRMRMLL